MNFSTLFWPLPIMLIVIIIYLFDLFRCLETGYCVIWDGCLRHSFRQPQSRNLYFVTWCVWALVCVCGQITEDYHITSGKVSVDTLNTEWQNICVLLNLHLMNFK